MYNNSGVNISLYEDHIDRNSTFLTANIGFSMTLGFLLAIVFAIGSFENAIVLTVLAKYKALQTSSNFILASLASANFLTTFIVAPLYCIEWLNIITFKMAEVHVVRESFIRLFFGISTITMAFISYDRYLHIRKLHNYKMSKKVLLIGLMICWFTPIAISSLYLPVVHFNSTYYCRIVSTIFSVIVLSIIIFLYIGILLLLKRHTEHTNDRMREMYIINQRRAGHTTAIILTVYLLMNGPAIINEVLYYSDEINMICAFLLMANSAVNPIIYFYQIPILKRHAFVILGRDKVRKNTVTVFGELNGVTMESSNV